jgi:hypothetical protein
VRLAQVSKDNDSPRAGDVDSDEEAEEVEMGTCAALHGDPSLVKDLKVLTWNVWHDGPKGFEMSDEIRCELLKARFRALGCEVETQNPHVACLQEMTRFSVAMLQTQEWSNRWVLAPLPLIERAGACRRETIA